MAEIKIDIISNNQSQGDINQVIQSIDKMDNALDNAAAGMKKAEKAGDNLTTATKGLGKHWDDLKTDVPVVGQAFALAVNPISLVATGVGALASLTQSSVNDWVDYNKQIRELGQATGISAEEISRIIQYGDDWGISVNQIRTSLEYANKNGFAPTIDNLANLADQYQATSDKQAFAAQLLRIFGRSYADIIPLLAKGGDALREGTAAVNDNLIATEESIRQSREYEVAVDNLGDSWQGFKNTIGRAVVPVLATALTAINDTTEAIQDQRDIAKEYYQMIDDGLIPAQEQSIGHLIIFFGDISLVSNGLGSIVNRRQCRG